MKAQSSLVKTKLAKMRCTRSGRGTIVAYHISRRIALGFFVVVVFFAGGQPAWADSYSFTTIDVPGATETYADGINNKHQIVGFFSDARGPHGFVDTGGVFTTIDPPYGPLVDSYFGIGINDRGQIVGTSNVLDANSRIVGSTGFLDRGGVFTKINAPGADFTQLLGINNSGQIIGFFSDANGTHGFVDTGGVFTIIQDPNASGASIPFGINNGGQIVGWFDEGATTHGYLYNNGIFTTIDDPAAPNATFSTGINDKGQIVGFYIDATGFHGFEDTNGTFTTINDPNAAGFGGSFAYAINDSVQVVGQFGNHSFVAKPVLELGTVATPVPEPGTVMLLVIGLTGIAFISRRRVMTSAAK